MASADHSQGRRFFEYQGACFLQAADSTVQEQPYCPRCQTPMLALSHVAPFLCGQCRGVTEFPVARISAIHREVLDLARQQGGQVQPPGA